MGEGFHDGELFVQRHAGVREEASRLAGMLAAPSLNGGMGRFAADRDLAMITARDETGDLWTSPLYGWHGFCEAQDATLVISGCPVDGDPLHHHLRPQKQVGALLIDFAKRRRLRVNGRLSRVASCALEIAVDQAFGNCPRYIQQRAVRRRPGVAAWADLRVQYSDRLEPEHIAQITRADMFVFGTVHPVHGADASHRGGSPGFVRVEHDRLWWPDYPGNNLFNSLGNLVEDPAAALLFLDFAAGNVLQLSGRAALEWITPGAPGDDGGTGRRVSFVPQRVATTIGLPYQLLDLLPYPQNPSLT